MRELIGGVKKLKEWFVILCFVEKDWTELVKLVSQSAVLHQQLQ